MISSALDLLSGLSLQQLGLGALGIGISIWMLASKAIAAVRGLIMQYALKKLAALGILGAVGSEFIPGFGIVSTGIDLVAGVIPI